VVNCVLAIVRRSLPVFPDNDLHQLEGEPLSKATKPTANLPNRKLAQVCGLYDAPSRSELVTSSSTAASSDAPL
jgi:hypothetical protein